MVFRSLASYGCCHMENQNGSYIFRMNNVFIVYSCKIFIELYKDNAPFLSNLFGSSGKLICHKCKSYQ